MGKFVLIGGGENGREGTKYETEQIDREIARLSNKNSDIHYLFLAHGNDYENSYYEVMSKIYKEKFNCECDILTKKEIENYDTVKNKIEWADIIYVGGGNTLKMMNLWKVNGFDTILKPFINSEKVFCGISAGAICWCKYGVSDSNMKTNNDDYIKVEGLNIFNTLFCPSYDERKEKEENLKKIMKESELPMLALEKGTAIVIEKGKCKAIRSLENKKIYKCFYKNENMYKIEIPIDKEYQSFEKLIATNEEIN